jgi:hypothetical protein
LGSGKLIKSAIKKYGSQFFLKQIISVFFSYAEVVAEESKIVNYKVINDPMSYNLRLGGDGHMSADEWTASQRNNHAKITKKRMQNKNEIEKLSFSLKLAWKDKNSGYWTEGAVARRREIGKELYKANKFGNKRGDVLPEHVVEKIIASKSQTWDIIHDGKIIQTNRLQNFCLERNISYTHLLDGELINGYKILRNKKRTKKEMISPEGKTKRILLELVEEYLKKGYIIYTGFVKKEMYKPDGTKTTINIEKLQEYLNKGYTIKNPNTKSRSKTWKLKRGNDVFEIENLHKFCKENNISYQNIRHGSVSNGYQILREHHVSG